jgi:hypothetical protein
MMHRNDEFPSCVGLTDAEIHARQYESRRVTARSTKPVCVRFSAAQLPVWYSHLVQLGRIRGRR